MPELPEVEIIARGLNKALCEQTIFKVQVLEVRSCTVSAKELDEQTRGKQVKQITRRGKLLIVELSGNVSLLVHLRMTGQLIYRSAAQDFGGGYPNRSLIGDLPDKSTRVIFTFEDGSHLYFNDQRKFGYIKPVSNTDIQADNFISKLGPEPLNDDFTAETFERCLPKNSKRSIKSVLLDQGIIAGIGNIYADESLFLAGIMPNRELSSLSYAQRSKLHVAIRSCMQQSIDDGGSTMRNYVDCEGLRGEFLDLHANVFNRNGRPCKVCGTIIQKTKVAGRGTHFCPKCQK